MKRVVVIAPHADDETLGLGGTLLKHVAEGDEVTIVVMTSTGEAKREALVEKVAREYGAKELVSFGLKPTALDQISFSDVVQKISAVISRVQPHVVYLPHEGDVHTDHQIAFKAAFSCTKSFRHPSIDRVLVYETISETDFASPTSARFVPTVFVDVTKTFAKKLSILRLYETEIAAHPFPRSEAHVDACAVRYGAAAGVAKAEAFMLLKEIVR